MLIPLLFPPNLFRLQTYKYKFKDHLKHVGLSTNCTKSNAGDGLDTLHGAKEREELIELTGIP